MATYGLRLEPLRKLRETMEMMGELQLYNVVASIALLGITDNDDKDYSAINVAIQKLLAPRPGITPTAALHIGMLATKVTDDIEYQLSSYPEAVSYTHPMVMLWVGKSKMVISVDAEAKPLVNAMGRYKGAHKKVTPYALDYVLIKEGLNNRVQTRTTQRGKPNGCNN